MLLSTSACSPGLEEAMDEKICEERIYVNLRDDGLHVSRSTDASRRRNWSCGDQVVDHPHDQTTRYVIEYCQLSPATFRAYRLARELEQPAFAERYGLTIEAVLRYEGLESAEA